MKQETLELKKTVIQNMNTLSEFAQSAVNAHHWTSFSPEKRGEQLIKEYEELLNDDINIIKNATEQQKTDYIEKFKKYFSNWLTAKSRCISPMITGGSNFPTRRAKKYNQWEDNKYQAFIEWRKRVLKAIKKSIEAAKSPEQKTEENWLKIRKSIIEAAATIVAIDKGIEKGYTRKLFTNSIANLVKSMAKNGQVEHVKRSLELIKEINSKYGKLIITEKSFIWTLLPTAEKAQADRLIETTQDNQVILFEEGKIILNYHLNRLQIVHDQKPDYDTRQNLKYNGFRWSPKNMAWQRYLNYASKCKAKIITGIEIK